MYTDSQGNPVSQDVIQDINQFQVTTHNSALGVKGNILTPLYVQGSKRSGTIDVWWLYDDGGLTLLLPYILTTRQQFSGCQLRVFSLANRKDELDRETRNMAALLAKFRIEFSSVIVIPDVTKKAAAATKAEFDNIIAGMDISPNELIAEREKTNR